jgi:hypothetical protein
VGILEVVGAIGGVVYKYNIFDILLRLTEFKEFIGKTYTAIEFYNSDFLEKIKEITGDKAYIYDTYRIQGSNIWVFKAYNVRGGLFIKIYSLEENGEIKILWINIDI